MSFEICVLTATAMNAAFLYLMSRQVSELDKRNDIEHRDMSYELKDRLNRLDWETSSHRLESLTTKYEQQSLKKRLNELPQYLWAKGEHKC